MSSKAKIKATPHPSGDKPWEGGDDDVNSARKKKGPGRITLAFGGLALLIGAYGAFVLWSKLQEPPSLNTTSAITPTELFIPEEYTLELTGFQIQSRFRGKRINTLLTPYLSIQTVDDVNAICARIPKIQDAINQVISKYRPELDSRQSSFDRISPPLLEAVNSSIGAGRELVTAIRIVVWESSIPGTRKSDTIICKKIGN